MSAPCVQGALGGFIVNEESAVVNRDIGQDEPTTIAISVDAYLAVHSALNYAAVWLDVAAFAEGDADAQARYRRVRDKCDTALLLLKGEKK